MEWKPEAESTDCPEAQKLMKPFARGKYSLPAELARYGLDVAKVLRG